MRDDIVLRAARHAALGDPVRLSIVDALAASDRASVELRRMLGIESNLLAHHLDVLEHVGVVTRTKSSGDGRRRYVRLVPASIEHLGARPALTPRRAVFVCTHNSARSQLAAAWWTRITRESAESAGTHPADTVHPGAVAAARRAGLDLSGAHPRHIDDVELADRLVVTVCDQAHESLEPDDSWLHWSIADPVEQGGPAAFDAAAEALRIRIVTMLQGEPA